MNACRGCMRATSGSRLKSLFADDTESCKINQLYGILTSLKASQSDGLPSSMCAECWQLFANMGKFRDMCLASDREYRNKLQAKNALLLAENNASTQQPKKSTAFSSQHEETHNDLVDDRSPHNSDSSPTNWNMIFEEYAENDDYEFGDIQNENVVDEESTTAPSSSSSRRINNDLKHDAGGGGDRLLECDLCGATFRSKPLIEMHMHKCHTDPMPKCDVCSATFSTWHALHLHRVGEEHIRVIASSTSPAAAAAAAAGDQQAKSKRKRTVPSAHQRRYKDMPANQVCEFCGKAFKTSMALADHMLIHQDPATYAHKCEFCDKRFGRKVNLEDHRKRHLNIRKFACAQCPARFVAQGELRRHMTRHNAEPTVPCPQCQRMFSSRHTMLVHIRAVHDMHRPFACNLCEQHFSCSWLLKAHGRQNHGIKGQSRKLYKEPSSVED